MNEWLSAASLELLPYKNSLNTRKYFGIRDVRITHAPALADIRTRNSRGKTSLYIFYAMWTTFTPNKCQYFFINKKKELDYHCSRWTDTLLNNQCGHKSVCVWFSRVCSYLPSNVRVSYDVLSSISIRLQELEINLLLKVSAVCLSNLHFSVPLILRYKKVAGTIHTRRCRYTYV